MFRCVKTIMVRFPPCRGENRDPAWRWNRMVLHFFILCVTRTIQAAYSLAIPAEKILTATGPDYNGCATASDSHRIHCLQSTRAINIIASWSFVKLCYEKKTDNSSYRQSVILRRKTPRCQTMLSMGGDRLFRTVPVHEA